MNILSKKLVIGLMAGAMVVTGAIGTYTAQAAASESQQTAQDTQKKGKHQPPKFDADKAAQGVADMFGVSKDEVLVSFKSNADFKDIGHAAMLAKVSGKSYADVFAMKTSSNKWSEIESSLGVTREQMKTAQQDVMSSMMEKRANISKDTAASLLKDGYRPQDIVSASVLAKSSNKEITAVLSMKKINNSWKDVAKELGVDEKTFHKEMKELGGPGLGFMGGPKGDRDGAPQGMPPQGAPDGSNTDNGQAPEPPTED